ncbi:MAG: hypothetical protein ACLUV5_01445 [Oscillospiraceae bacterium]|jgi:hypothetical protein
MEEIKKAIMSGVSERPEVGVGRTMTPTDKAILMLVLVLGARQNLRNDDNITITADDVQGYYPLSVVDDCITDLIEYGGYVDCNQYPIIDYYEHKGNTIYIQSPYLQALYHYIAAQRDSDAPYADLADKLTDELNYVLEEVM